MVKCAKERKKEKKKERKDSLNGHLNYFILFILLLEREREQERDGGKHQCGVASHAPPTGDLAINPGKCPDWESNWPPLDSQASTQSTKPHQPRLNFLF